jgi:hypothetical protein
MQERRKEQRWPAYLGGRIVFDCRQRTADCIVRNTSSDGACLRLDGASLLPDEFSLRIPMRGVELQVRTRWRRFGELGVEAVVTGAEPVDLELARRMRALDRSNRALKRRLADLTDSST